VQWSLNAGERLDEAGLIFEAQFLKFADPHGPWPCAPALSKARKQRAVAALRCGIFCGGHTSRRFSCSFSAQP